VEHVCWQNALHNVYALTSYQNLAGMQECDRANVLRGENRVLCVERSSLVLSMHRCNNLVCIRIICVFNDNIVMRVLLHHMTRPGSILEGFRYTYVKVIRHALESGLFPLSQHPINTNRVRAVPLVLDPQLLPR